MGRDESNSHVARCSFCGKSESMVNKLIEGPGVFICDDCISLCYDLISADSAPKRSENKQAPDMVLPKPIDIKNKLDEYVVGQDEAKKVLSVAVYNHYSVFFTAATTMSNFKKATFCFWVRQVLVKQCLRKRLHAF